MLWRCGVCGYVHDGDDAPAKCPKCGAPKEMFSKIGPDEQKLIESSRTTNEMHVAIMGMMKKMQKWAKTIKQENLDPPCVAIADRWLKDTHETIQAIKAELQGHMNKKKWG